MINDRRKFPFKTVFLGLLHLLLCFNYHSLWFNFTAALFAWIFFTFLRWRTLATSTFSNHFLPDFRELLFVPFCPHMFNSSRVWPVGTQTIFWRVWFLSWNPWLMGYVCYQNSSICMWLFIRMSKIISPGFGVNETFLAVTQDESFTLICRKWDFEFL